MLRVNTLLFVFGILVSFTSCKQRNIVKHNGEKDLISFKSLFGINFTEISRRTDNGLSFNEYGFELEPQWRMKFESNDSVSIYSPTKGRFINFPLTRGYDSIFNTARTWLKVKAMTKDSLKLEILAAYGDTVDTRGVKTFMTFYSDDYVRNKLHSDTSILKRPSQKDSSFIKSLSTAANKDYHKAFAARYPVVIETKSPLVKIEKWIANGDILNNFDLSDNYMNPTFDVVISKAYANFYYSFSIYLDTAGNMHYGKPLIPFSDKVFEENYIHLSTAVMNSYMKYYLKFIPGTTLNIPHTSEINVHVTGNKGK